MGVQESQSDSTERRDNCYYNLKFFLPWENTEQFQSKATDGVGVCRCCGGVLTIQSSLPSSAGIPGTRNKQAVPGLGVIGSLSWVRDGERARVGATVDVYSIGHASGFSSNGSYGTRDLQSLVWAKACDIS
ncbi:hypothetical protein B0H13DRAFT_1856183 [Mycena leptocephala]|nr:hypothetical protein B0H13DRAFT_1856183 [Mycena leptocephala]